MLEKDAECPGGISMSTTNRLGASLVATTTGEARIKRIVRHLGNVVAAARQWAPRLSLPRLAQSIARHDCLFAMANFPPGHARVAIPIYARLHRQANRTGLFPQHP